MKLLLPEVKFLTLEFIVVQDVVRKLLVTKVTYFHLKIMTNIQAVNQ